MRMRMRMLFMPVGGQTAGGHTLANDLPCKCRLRRLRNWNACCGNFQLVRKGYSGRYGWNRGLEIKEIWEINVPNNLQLYVYLDCFFFINQINVLNNLQLYAYFIKIYFKIFFRPFYFRQLTSSWEKTVEIGRQTTDIINKYSLFLLYSLK